jgi:hypothetical protein
MTSYYYSTLLLQIFTPSAVSAICTSGRHTAKSSGFRGENNDDIAFYPLLLPPSEDPLL